MKKQNKYIKDKNKISSNQKNKNQIIYIYKIKGNFCILPRKREGKKEGWEEKSSLKAYCQSTTDTCLTIDTNKDLKVLLLTPSRKQ